MGIHASINPSKYLTTRIRDVLQRAGTKDTNLIRVMIYIRAEYDIDKIKQPYFNLYNRNIIVDVKSDTHWEYKKKLLYILINIKFC